MKRHAHCLTGEKPLLPEEFSIDTVQPDGSFFELIHESLVGSEEDPLDISHETRSRYFEHRIQIDERNPLLTPAYRIVWIK